MLSLYRKAEIIRKDEKLTRLINREIPPSQDDFNISPREEEEVLDHLDNIVYKRTGISSKAFLFDSQKKDATFPLIVNLAVTAVIIFTVIIFSVFTATEENSITSASGSLYSTEGRLLRKLREDSELQIREKDAEISETRQRLIEIDNERNMLLNDMESRISLREKEISNRFEQLLEQERLKLAEENLSTAEVEERLKQFEQESREENEAQLAAFISQLETEKKLNEENLDIMRTDLERQLLEHESDKTDLLSELERVRADYSERIEAGEAAGAAAVNKITEEYERLRSLQQKNEIIIDRIQGFYRQINEALSNEDPDKALAAVEALEVFLSGESVAALKTVNERRDLDRFLIDSIKELISRDNTETEPPQTGTSEQVLELTEVSELISEADEFYFAGDIENASKKYVEALSKIPALKQAYDKLSDINESEFITEIENLSERLQQAEITVAAEKEIQAELENDLQQLSSRIEELRFSSDRNNEILARITEAEKVYGQNITDEADETSRAELFDLLEAKLLLKEIIISESVRKEYPELYENIEEYFIKFGEEKRLAGQYSAMKDVIAFISILSETGSEIRSEITSDPQNGLGNTLYIELLEKLRKLIEAET